MKLDFSELADYCQALALASKLSPDSSAVWRKMCRIYSSKFNTPLHQVLDMDPEHVLLNVFEDQIDDRDEDENLDKFLDIIYSLEDPEYEAQKEGELEEFIKQAEEEEKERLANKKPIHPSLRYESEIERPKSGSIDLSYLEKEEQ